MMPPSRIMGSAWISMALPCLVTPSFVIKHSIHQSILREQPGQHENKLSCFILRCFGAQAMLVGMLLLHCDFTKYLYKMWGLTILPFFVFDIAAYQAGYLTAFGAIGDAVGNIIFTTCSAIGAGLFDRSQNTPS